MCYAETKKFYIKEPINLFLFSIQAKIHLHRHKTVIRACRGKKSAKEKLPEPPISLTDNKKNQGVGDLRIVKLNKGPREGLGISITGDLINLILLRLFISILTGGNEHGVPILISEIDTNGPAYRSNSLYIGDAILEVNEIDLRNSKHAQAVEILSNLVSKPIEDILKVKFLKLFYL
jgi:hypothetical protein